MLTQVEVHAVNQSILELPLIGGEVGINPIQIRNITGIGPVSAAVNTTPYGSVDGESYTGSSVGKRNIVLTLGLNPNWVDQTISSLRHLLYAYFMPRQQVTLRFFRSDLLPTCEIVGYVESCEPNIFSRDPEMQVSIICPLPDFVGIEPVVANGIVALNPGGFETIYYVGTIKTGFVLKVTKTPDNESFVGRIYVVSVNNVTGQRVVSAVTTVDESTYFEMSSVRGSKYVHLMTVVEDIPSSSLHTLDISGGWNELESGENSIAVQATEPGQYWELSYFNRFGGL